MVYVRFDEVRFAENEKERFIEKNVRFAENKNIEINKFFLSKI